MRLSRPLAALAVAATLSTGLLALPGTASAATRVTVAHEGGSDHGSDRGRERRDPRIKRFELRGTIEAVDPELHTLTATVRVKRHGQRVTLHVPMVLANNAWVMVNGEPAAQGDLQVGDRVQIGGVVLKRDDGTRWLLGIRVKATGERTPPDPGTD